MFYLTSFVEVGIWVVAIVLMAIVESAWMQRKKRRAEQRGFEVKLPTGTMPGLFEKKEK